MKRSGATLIVVRAADAVEAIACEVFKRCEASNQGVSMSASRDVLDELRAHRATCRCGRCGETVAKARADREFVTAQVWQRSVTATRAWRSLAGSEK